MLQSEIQRDIHCLSALQNISLVKTQSRTCKASVYDTVKQWMCDGQIFKNHDHIYILTEDLIILITIIRKMNDNENDEYGLNQYFDNLMYTTPQLYDESKKHDIRSQLQQLQDE